MSRDPIRDEIPPGTLYMLILKTLARGGKMHGFEIGNYIQQISEDVTQVEEGSLYPSPSAHAPQWMSHRRMGCDGWKPPGALLHIDQSWSQTMEAELSQF